MSRPQPQLIWPILLVEFFELRINSRQLNAIRLYCSSMSGIRLSSATSPIPRSIFASLWCSPIAHTPLPITQYPYPFLQFLLLIAYRDLLSIRNNLHRMQLDRSTIMILGAIRVSSSRSSLAAESTREASQCPNKTHGKTVGMVMPSSTLMVSAIWDILGY